MGKKIGRIEEIICPGEGKLQTNDGIATANIVDIELDPLECTFNNDMCVQINTEGYSYITLSEGNLEKLQTLIDEAYAYYNDL